MDAVQGMAAVMAAMLHLGERNYVVVRNLPGTETNQLSFVAWVNCWDNKATGIVSEWHPNSSRDEPWQSAWARGAKIAIWGPASIHAMASTS